MEKKTETTNYVQLLGKYRLEENAAKGLTGSGEIPSPRQTSTKTITTASLPLNAPRAFGAPTHPGTTGVAH